MKILMTGATGLIGRDLGIELVRRGHQIVVISRDAKKAILELPFPCEVVEGDLMQGPIQDSNLSDVIACVNLIGENVGDGRWTEEKKKRILKSRVEGTRNLCQSLQKSGNKSLKVFVATSAAGFYGDRKDEELTESSQAGQGFLAEVCQAWEREAFAILDERPEIRLAVIRLGVVLTPFGGALEKMRLPFQMGAGAAVGSGQQWMSWIHLQDAVRMFAWAVETDAAEGIFNGTAPNPVRNLEFSRRLAEIFSKGMLPAVPGFALQALLGEMSSALLGSAKVIPEQTLAQGFKFQFPEVGAVFKEFYQYFGEGDSILRIRQYLPVAREKVFPFFSDAKNLEMLTPPFLSFKIENMSTAQVQQGSLIDYKLKLHGLPVRWRTKIEEWHPEEKFVDVQLKGPYEKWQHLHLFEKLGPGTLVTDLVRYKVPWGWMGKATAGWKVAQDVDEIFRYRRETLSTYDFARS